MAHNIKVKLNGRSIGNAIRQLTEYRDKSITTAALPIRYQSQMELLALVKWEADAEKMMRGDITEIPEQTGR